MNTSMSDKNKNRWWMIVLVALIILMVAGIVGFQVALGILKGKVVSSLGPDSEVHDIRVGWSAVDIEGLRIKGPGDWPATDTIRADHVTIVPSLRSLFSGQYRIHSITIANPYLSLYRTKAGKLLVIPSLLSKKATPETPSTPAVPLHKVTIGNIILKDGVAEFFDASVGRRPMKIRLDKIQVTIDDIVVPALDARSRFTIKGVVKGIHQDGRAEISGWADLSTKDSSMKLQLRSVDMKAIEPYLIKASDTGVRKGNLDLDLKSDVRNNRMKAPGRMTISDLTLASSKGIMGTFMGVPREAVLSYLKDKGNSITLDFVLEGDINNPTFSLNETMSQRMAVSMSDLLNVSIGGVAKGAAALGKEGVDAAEGVVNGVGGAIHQLFSNQRKH
jgi:hypothetical protein